MSYINLLVTPCLEKYKVLTVEKDSVRFLNQKTYPIVEEVPILLETALQATDNNFYEQFYQSQEEPWAYSERAAEILRHEYVAEQVKAIYKEKGRKLTILDLGCSLGHITERLYPYGELIIGLDISLTAVLSAKKRCDAVVKTGENPFNFVVASTLELPFKEDSFDVVIASDGIAGWFDNNEKTANSQKAVAEIYRVLKKRGIAIHTDYMNPKFFDQYVRLTLSSPFQKIKEEPLYDRLWYRLESLLKIARKQAWAKSILANMTLARILKSIAKLLGRNYSKHIGVTTKKMA